MGASRKTDWPAWWDWELELTAHVLKRMVDRRFSEVDLRSMSRPPWIFARTMSLGAGS